jgi:hypothetical protein
VCALLWRVYKQRRRRWRRPSLRLRNGASVRSVAELGLSANTVQKYGRAHGWPTEENRERFYESRYDREEREGLGDSRPA